RRREHRAHGPKLHVMDVGRGGGPNPQVVKRLLEAWRGEIEARQVYELLAAREQDPRRADILRRIAEAEAGHRRRIEERLVPLGAPVPDGRSARSSPWHRTSSGWVSDAIYGANDGLAAVFGIVAGVSGATGASTGFVRTAGLAGAIASALSMGVGAWLAARSTTEIAEANIEQERSEIL